MPDATTYSAKKAKTTSTGPLLYSELDISNLTVDATLMGSNETRFATVKYNDARMVYHEVACPKLREYVEKREHHLTKLGELLRGKDREHQNLQAHARAGRAH